MEDIVDMVYEMIKKYIVEYDDYGLEWEEFHRKYPQIDEWEYNMGAKKYQEV